MTDLVAVSPTDRRILELIQPSVEAMGYELVRLRYGGQKEKTLQIMVDKADEGIDINDCGKVSRAVSAVLEVEIPDQESYTLEVSSTGIDRPLTRLNDFKVWAGHLAKVETSVPVDGRRRFKGKIRGVEGNNVLIAAEDEVVVLDFESLVNARLVLTDELIAKGNGGGK